MSAAMQKIEAAGDIRWTVCKRPEFDDEYPWTVICNRFEDLNQYHRLACIEDGSWRTYEEAVAAKDECLKLAQDPEAWR